MRFLYQSQVDDRTCSFVLFMYDYAADLGFGCYNLQGMRLAFYKLAKELLIENWLETLQLLIYLKVSMQQLRFLVYVQYIIVLLYQISKILWASLFDGRR